MGFVIPVFIPHEGCPHCCVFCNQHSISGRSGKEVVRAQDVTGIIETWLGYRRNPSTGPVQVAFYGGSFTGLPLVRQQELLGAVRPFLDHGSVDTIRLSTRPDYVSPEILIFLRDAGVSVVELGIQSLDDAVLRAAGRGHDSARAVLAIKQLKTAGFAVGAQLMIGLPGQRFRSLAQTVSRIVSLKPDFARLYPVLVLRGSPLATQYEQHSYDPLSLSKAVVLSAWAKQRLTAHGVPVVRMGLQPGPELEDALLAGPYHPAFGEMVNARIMLQQIRALLCRVLEGRRQILRINPKDQSVFRGVRSANLKRLTSLGLADRFALQADPVQARLTVVAGELE